MSGIEIAVLVVALVGVVIILLLEERQAELRRSMSAMYEELRPGEDPRMVAVAIWYGAPLDWVRGRIAKGHRIGHALGHTLLFPPAPPRPPARSE